MSRPSADTPLRVKIESVTRDGHDAVMFLIDPGKAIREAARLLEQGRTSVVVVHFFGDTGGPVYVEASRTEVHLD